MKKSASPLNLLWAYYNKKLWYIQHPFFILAFALVALLHNPRTIYANELLVTVDPAYQDVTIEEKQAGAETVLSFTNHTKQTQELELFALDFKQTDVIGSIGFLDSISADYPHTLASFLEFDAQNLIIAPESKANVKITIQNRASLSPGGHYAAVIARIVEEKTAGQQVRPAVSALFLVRKMGGERYHISLADTAWKPGSIVATVPQKIDLLFQNDGNVHEIPRGSAEITDIFGRVIYQGTINESSLYLLPGTPRRIKVELSKRAFLMPITFLTLKIQGKGQFSNISYSTESSFIFIHLFTIPILLGLCASTIVYKKYKQILFKKDDEKKI